MSSVEIGLPLPLREEPALGPAFLLSLGMHLLLVAVLVFGVNWQTREPAPVVLELWTPPTPVPVVQFPAEAPAPAPVPPPEPAMKKPDIALKAAPRIEKPKPPPPKPAPEKQKPAAKPVQAPAPKAALPAKDPEHERRMKELLAREQASISAQRQEEEMRLLLAKQQAEGAARSARLAGWTDKIRGKIRGNIVMPLDIKGNPEAVFDVVQIPTGEVIDVKLRKSSGNRGYDDAVERAIRKSSPLPRPDDSRDFQRLLELKFRPVD
jgi:colicin import membrane protein